MLTKNINEELVEMNYSGKSVKIRGCGYSLCMIVRSQLRLRSNKTRKSMSYADNLKHVETRLKSFCFCFKALTASMF